MHVLTPQQRQTMQRKAQRERAAGYLNAQTAALIINAAMNSGWTYSEAEAATIQAAHDCGLTICHNLPRGAWTR